LERFVNSGVALPCL